MTKRSAAARRPREVRREARRVDRAPRRTRDERRAELLEAAITVIRREGPAASMEQIAAEAGVTKPIVYRFFDGRDGLTRAVAERFAGELLAELRGELESDLDARALMTTTIDTYLSFVERDPNIYRYLVRQALSDPDDAGIALSGFINGVGQKVSRVIGDRMKALGVDTGAAEPWGYGIVGMVHLAGDWWQARRTMSRERLMEYLTSLLWDGIGGTIERSLERSGDAE